MGKRGVGVVLAKEGVVVLDQVLMVVLALKGVLRMCYERMAGVSYTTWASHLIAIQAFSTMFGSFRCR